MLCFAALVLLFVPTVDAKLESCGYKGAMGSCDAEWKAMMRERHDLTVPADASIEEYCKILIGNCSAASNVVVCLANYRRVCKTSLDRPTMKLVRSLPYPSTGSDRLDKAVRMSRHGECVRLRGLLKEFLEGSKATKRQF